MNDLTPRELKFIDTYMRTDNKSKAVIEAGYCKEGVQERAKQLLNRPRVRDEIHQRRKLMVIESVISCDDVIHGLLAEATNQENTGSARVAAWAHLAKILGMFVDKIEDVTPAPPQVVIEVMNE